MKQLFKHPNWRADGTDRAAQTEETQPDPLGRTSHENEPKVNIGGQEFAIAGLNDIASQYLQVLKVTKAEIQRPQARLAAIVQAVECLGQCTQARPAHPR